MLNPVTQLSATRPMQMPVSCLSSPLLSSDENSAGTTGRLEEFEAGDVIYWEGDPNGSVYEVAEGVLRLCRVMSDGRRGITGFAYPGDLVGLGTRDCYGETAEAATCAILRRHSRKAILDQSSRSPELGRRLFGIVAEALSAAQERMILLGRMSAVEKIACFLLEAARKTGAKRNLHLPLCRADIADYLGLTIETVSRTLTRLRQAGIISLPTPQMVVLLKRDELERIGDAGEEWLSAPAAHRHAA